jgi:hypothetical protein
MTHRRFTRVRDAEEGPELMGIHGERLTLRDSSTEEAASLWLFISEPGVNFAGAAHLDVDQALAVAAALVAFVKRHTGEEVSV